MTKMTIVCPSDNKALTNIGPTNHVHPAFRYRGRFRFRVCFNVTVMVAQLAIPPGCSLLEYRMP